MQDLFSVKSKIVLISGASRGIGLELAKGFKSAGATVVGTGSRPESLTELKKEDIECYAANNGHPTEFADVIKQVHAKYGKIDVLINNAGVASNNPASAIKTDEMDQMIDINFKGVFRACQAYYKLHRKTGGSVINVASILGLVGAPLAGVYCGTKGAVVQMTRALAIEWAGSGIRLNALCPGFIDTDMTAMIKDRASVYEKFVAQIPFKRMGRPEELLGACLFMASDASSYMTGQTLVVDGGITAM